VRLRQVRLPFTLHERLWPLKYLIFIGLFAISLNSLHMAFVGAEVEPFKTAISLVFVRYWPFVLYAVALLAAGLSSSGSSVATCVPWARHWPFRPASACSNG
jgi:NosR/NirI family transcriptional regulator, nitrous oxide reductase regulator